MLKSWIFNFHCIFIIIKYGSSQSCQQYIVLPTVETESYMIAV